MKNNLQVYVQNAERLLQEILTSLLSVIPYDEHVDTYYNAFYEHVCKAFDIMYKEGTVSDEFLYQIQLPRELKNTYALQYLQPPSYYYTSHHWLLLFKKLYYEQPLPVLAQNEELLKELEKMPALLQEIRDILSVVWKKGNRGQLPQKSQMVLPLYARLFVLSLFPLRLVKNVKEELLVRVRGRRKVPYAYKIPELTIATMYCSLCNQQEYAHLRPLLYVLYPFAPYYEEIGGLVKENIKIVQDIIVFMNIALVYNQVHALYGKRNSLKHDLYSEGVLALYRALEVYDPLSGYAFTTYALPYIRSYLQTALATQQYTVALPLSEYRNIRNIRRDYLREENVYDTEDEFIKARGYKIPQMIYLQPDEQDSEEEMYTYSAVAEHYDDYSVIVFRNYITTFNKILSPAEAVYFALVEHEELALDDIFDIINKNEKGDKHTNGLQVIRADLSYMLNFLLNNQHTLWSYVRSQKGKNSKM